MTKLIHYQPNMTCLTATEFSKLIDRLETAEKDLAESQKRVTLLEETLRISEAELKSANKTITELGL
jgi:hypothetical protein